MRLALSTATKTAAMYAIQGKLLMKWLGRGLLFDWRLRYDDNDDDDVSTTMMMVPTTTSDDDDAYYYYYYYVT